MEKASASCFLLSSVRQRQPVRSRRAERWAWQPLGLSVRHPFTARFRPQSLERRNARRRAAIRLCHRQERPLRPAKWPNRDPLGERGFQVVRDLRDVDAFADDGLNVYVYVFNNPNGFIDTDGLSGTIALPILFEPKSPNPINLAFCAGAGAGTALCLAFPNTMTKPGEWIGNWICPMKGERNWQGKDPNPWKGYRPKDPNDPSKGGWKKDQNGKDYPVPRPPGPPPKNHPSW